MLTREQVEKFAKERFNDEKTDDRISDIGFAFKVSHQPRQYLDDPYGKFSHMQMGSGPLIVIKKTGEVYQFGSNPLDKLSSTAYEAKTQEEFDAALQGIDPFEFQVAHIVLVDKTEFIIDFKRESLGDNGGVLEEKSAVTEELAQKFAIRYYGTNYSDIKINDVGFAFTLTEKSGTPTISSCIVIKETGYVYHFGSSNLYGLSKVAFGAKSQDEFDAALQAALQKGEGQIFQWQLARLATHGPKLLTWFNIKSLDRE